MFDRALKKLKARIMIYLSIQLARRWQWQLHATSSTALCHGHRNTPDTSALWHRGLVHAMPYMT
jgi:hypothetical protein